MDTLFNVNGLQFWDAREIRLRRRFEEHFAAEIEANLRETNPAWRFFQCEAPILTPRKLLNANYTNEDVWVQENPTSSWKEQECREWLSDTDNCEKLRTYIRNRKEPFEPSQHRQIEEHSFNMVLHNLTVDDIFEAYPEIFTAWQKFTNQFPVELVLRPETTPSSYAYAEYLMTHQIAHPPYVVWQTGKSFRREQEQPSKHCRFKEFYQQEFQCIFSADTLNDYQEQMLEPVRKMIAEVVGLPTRIVESDRLPSYSLRTMDIEVDNGDKWMEVCSISKRTDLPFQATFVNPKKGTTIKKDCLVLEIAVGLDRVTYCFNEASKLK